MSSLLQINNLSDGGRDNNDQGNRMASSSSSTDNVQTSRSSHESEIKHFWSPTGVRMDYERERNLLVSVSVGTEAYKIKILDLAITAMNELVNMATENEPLWHPSVDGRVLNGEEYIKQFGQVGATIETMVRKRGMEQQPLQPPNLSCPSHFPALPIAETYTYPLQTEASRETMFFAVHPVHIVELLMNNVGLHLSIN